MYRVHELGEVNGGPDTKVYDVTGPKDTKIKSATVRSAVQSAEYHDETITMGSVIVEVVR